MTEEGGCDGECVYLENRKHPARKKHNKDNVYLCGKCY